MVINNCKICGQEKKIYAKGLCSTCYQRESKRNKTNWPIAQCETCGKDFGKKYKDHKYCSVKCRPVKRKQIGICSRCSRERLLRLNGFCMSCYRISRKTQRPIITCKSCGLDKPHFARNLCENCYCSLWQRKKYKESEETRNRISDYGKDNRDQKNEISKKSYLRNKAKRIIQQKDCEKFRYRKEKCFACGRTDNLEVHHLTYDDKSNIIILCKKCHSTSHRKHTYKVKWK